MHFEGQGVPRDSSQALKWYKAAAEQGNPEGQLQLGLMYLMGIALARNTPQALKLLKLSADQGTRDAQVFLGLAHRNLQDAPARFPPGLYVVSSGSTPGRSARTQATRRPRKTDDPRPGCESPGTRSSLEVSV